MHKNKCGWFAQDQENYVLSGRMINVSPVPESGEGFCHEAAHVHIRVEWYEVRFLFDRFTALSQE